MASSQISTFHVTLLSFYLNFTALYQWRLLLFMFSVTERDTDKGNCRSIIITGKVKQTATTTTTGKVQFRKLKSLEKLIQSPLRCTKYISMISCKCKRQPIEQRERSKWAISQIEHRKARRSRSGSPSVDDAKRGERISWLLMYTTEKLWSYDYVYQKRRIKKSNMLWIVSRALKCFPITMMIKMSSSVFLLFLLVGGGWGVIA